MFRKYFEQGYVPIPIHKGGKHPAIAADWSKFCVSRPSDEQIDEWDEQRIKNGWNIGVTCGPASGIVVLDIDVDDRAILDACPISPVARRGAKGEARFFRYDSSVQSRSWPGLDIMSDGRQVLVPPSIHPVTKKPYIWLTPDTIESIKPEELPLLDLSFLNRVLPMLKSKVDTSTLNGGRNNKLRDMISAMRSRGEPEGKIVQEIYEWDLNWNTPRLFTDPKEQYKAKTEAEAKRAAWLMVSNVTRSLINSGAAILDDSENLVVHITAGQEKSAQE